MIKIEKVTKKALIDLLQKKNVGLEGNIIKVIDAEDDVDFQEYLKTCKQKDIDMRKKRLEVTKQVQQQNKELSDLNEANKKIQIELQNEMVKSEEARIAAESAKKNAENDLDLLQKKTQNELTSTIVKVALWVILSVGFITTLMYMVALYTKQDTQIIGSTWSNMFGILLTNAFSIVGTIMGIKYATGNKENNEG